MNYGKCFRKNKNEQKAHLVMKLLKRKKELIFTNVNNVEIKNILMRLIILKHL